MSLQGVTQHMPGVQHSIKLRIKGIITCFASLTSKLLLCIGKPKVFKNSLSSNAVQMFRCKNTVWCLTKVLRRMHSLLFVTAFRSEK